MALRDRFSLIKAVVGGMRSDAPPVIADGDPAPLRLNSSSELFVTIGSTEEELDVNIDEVGGTNVETGGTAGLLGVGVNRIGGTVVENGGVAGLQGVGLNRYGGTAVVTGGVAGLPGVGVNKWGGTDVVDGGPSGTVGVGGPVGHDVASTQNPVLGGAVATAAAPVAVVEGRLAQLSTNLTGWLRTLGDLTHIGGTAVVTPGLAGVLQTGGGEADGAALVTTYAQRVGGYTRGVLTALTDARKQTLLFDLLGQLYTRNAGYDGVADAGRGSVNTSADDRSEDGAPQVWAADTNIAVSPTYYPSTSGQAIGNWEDWCFEIQATDATLTLEHSLTGGAGGPWFDVTPSVRNNVTSLRSATSFATGAGAAANWDLSIRGVEGGFLRWKVIYPDAGNAMTIKAAGRY